MRSNTNIAGVGAQGYFYYDPVVLAGIPQEIAEYDGGDSGLVRRYIRLPGSVDEVMLMIDYTRSAGCDDDDYGACEVWAHQNRLGSTVATTDDSGAVEDEYRYSSFGESGSEGDSGFPFRFTGQKLDAATGLYFYKARYYDPEVGRFMQTDPIGYEDQMNLYAYVGNDPINMWDPTGNCTRGKRVSKSRPGCRITGRTTGKKDPTYNRSEPYYESPIAAYGYGFRKNPNPYDRAQIDLSEYSTIRNLEQAILSGNTLQRSISQAVRTGNPASYNTYASIQTSVPGAGEVIFDIDGTVSVSGDEWTLTATVTPRDEPYDMNAKPWGERNPAAEAGARASNAAGYNNFVADYKGSFEIEAKGKVPKVTCTGTRIKQVRC